MTARLRPTGDDDIVALMNWFKDERALRRWAGPAFRFPFTEASFREDLRADRVASFALDDDGVLAGFGQVYERWGRMNLARLAVNPALRGRGLGRRLLEGLMAAGRDDPGLDEFSLFVYRDNVAAWRLYESAGFREAACPADDPRFAGCVYLTRSAA